jgi:hypothetical protein
VRRTFGVAVACLSLTAVVRAQPAPYRPVTIATVHADPAGFHGELVMVTGRVERRENRFIVSDGTVSLRVLSRSQVEEGFFDIRGVMLDVGRLQKGDPLLDRLAFKIPFEEIYGDRWPKPGEELVLAAASVTRASGAIVEIAVPPPLPLEVNFSVPVEGEADVRLNTRIRLQFSREVNAASLRDRIRLSYSTTDSAERGEVQPPALAFTTSYDAGSHVLEIRPTQSLERFRPVRLDLLEGIVGTDGSALHPWSLRFTTGGS